MDTPDLSPARTSGDQSVKEAADALRKRCGAHRDQLLALAGYVDTLVETARVVDTACLDARAIVTAAECEAEAIRTAALESSRQLIEEARGEVERLRAEIAALEAERTGLETMPREQRYARDAGVESRADAIATSHDVVQTATLVRTDAAIDAGREPTTRERLAGFFDGVTLEPAPGPEDQPGGQLGGTPGLRSWLRGRRLAAIGILAVALLATTWWARGRSVAEAPRAAAHVAAATHAMPPVARPAPAAQQAPAVSAPEVPGPVAVETSSAPATPKVEVTLRAARAAWIRTGIDGVLDHGGFIAAGQERTLSGDREVEIRTADAGALFVSVNGAAETTLGRNGAAASRRWTRDGSSDSASVRASAAPGPSDIRADGTSSRSAVATTGVSTP